MELRHLRYFEAVASTLNFTRAAERLHIAQPPLSRQIQQLEEELGVTLLDRSARPIALTRAGAFFYEQTIQVLARLDEVTKTTRKLGAGQRRWLGIGFVPSMLYGPLPTTIRRFMEQNPDIDVVLSELTSGEQVAALQSGRIDVGFGRVAIDAEGVSNRLIAEEPLVAVVPVDSTLAELDEIPVATLSEQLVMVYPAHPRPSFADQVINQFRARGTPIHRPYETNGLQTAIGLVASGLGVSIVPKSVQRLRRDDVVYKTIADLGMVSPILVTTRKSDISEDLNRLCEAVTESIAQDLMGQAA